MNRISATDATTRLLKADELAARWGLHRATVYRMIARGELPALRIGGSIRVAEDEARAWLYSDPKDAA
jgi:excisionase family DNA binding protein